MNLLKENKWISLEKIMDFPREKMDFARKKKKIPEIKRISPKRNFDHF